MSAISGNPEYIYSYRFLPPVTRKRQSGHIPRRGAERAEVPDAGRDPDAQSRTHHNGGSCCGDRLLRGRAGNSQSRREFQQATLPGLASSLSSTCRSITSFQTASVSRYSPHGEALAAGSKAGLAQVAPALAAHFVPPVRLESSSPQSLVAFARSG